MVLSRGNRETKIVGSHTICVFLILKIMNELIDYVCECVFFCACDSINLWPEESRRKEKCQTSLWLSCVWRGYVAVQYNCSQVAK